MFGTQHNARAIQKNDTKENLDVDGKLLKQIYVLKKLYIINNFIIVIYNT